MFIVLNFYTNVFYIFFFRFKIINKSFKSYKLNVFIKIKVDNKAIPPPIRPEKKFVKKCNNILLINPPNKLQGIVTKIYLKLVFNKLNLKEGIFFFIILKFNNDIEDIDNKKDKITEFMLINGVKIISVKNKIKEPIK